MSDFNVVLAERTGLGQIQLCGCRSVHLSLGPVTLCLAPEAFAQAAIMIRDAMAQLAEITGKETEETVPEPAAAHRLWTH